MSSAEAMDVVAKIWNARTAAMGSARREQTLARLEGRHAEAKRFEEDVAALEYEVNALAFTLDVLRKS